VQVLSEFFWTVTRKLSVPLIHDEATAEVRRLVALASVVPVTQDLLDKALDMIASHGLTLWDAQIVAAARLTGAKVVLSEDLQHRQTIDGVTIVNPFAPDFVASEILGP
jgi:predicted nucleic acid-binding protein